MAKSGNGAETPALASAINAMEGEAKVLLHPDRPIDTDTSGQRVGEGAGLHANGRSDAGVKTLPGADPDLQALLHGSPFLDLSSPMTPYEWFKFFVMVSGIIAYIRCYSVLHPDVALCPCSDTAFGRLCVGLARCTPQH